MKRKWDLFLDEVMERKDIKDVQNFLNKIDRLKMEVISEKDLEALEKEYLNILPLLHDEEKFDEKDRDRYIRNINLKLKTFKKRLGNKVEADLGEYLRDLRESKGYSMKDLENMSGVTSSYIHRIESGSRNPSVQKLKQLAEALDVDVKVLLKKKNMEDVIEDIDIIKFIKNERVLYKDKVLTDRDKRKIIKAIENALKTEV